MNHDIMKLKNILYFYLLAFSPQTNGTEVDSARVSDCV